MIQAGSVSGSGAGGSLVIADADRRMTVAYVMNKMAFRAVHDRPAHRGGAGRAGVRHRESLSHALRNATDGVTLPNGPSNDLHRSVVSLDSTP